MDVLAFVALIINGSLTQLPVKTVPTTIDIPLNECSIIEAMVDPSSIFAIQMLGDAKYLGYPSPKYFKALACGRVRLRVDEWKPLGHKLKLSIKRVRVVFAGSEKVSLNGSAAIVRVESMGPVDVRGRYVYVINGTSGGGVVAVVYGDYVELSGVGIAELTVFSFGEEGVWVALPWLGIELAGHYEMGLREVPMLSPNQTLYIDEPSVELRDVKLDVEGCVVRAVLRNKTLVIGTPGGFGSVELDAAPYSPIRVAGREVTSLVIHLADGGTIRLKDFQIVDRYGNSLGRCVPDILDRVLVRFVVNGRRYLRVGEVSGDSIHVYTNLVNVSISVTSPIQVSYNPTHVLAETGENITITIILNGKIVGTVDATVAGPSLIVDASHLFTRYRLVDLLGVELVGSARVFTIYGVLNASNGYVIAPRELSGELAVEYLGARFNARVSGGEIVVEALSAKTIVELSAVAALASLIIQGLSLKRVTSGDTAD